MNTEPTTERKTRKRKLAWYKRQYGAGLIMGCVVGMAVGLVLAAIIVSIFS